jgi:replicative superfamily II helicase
VTHAYLVPFRALAEEVWDSLHQLVGGSARLRIVTGDHRDPVKPQDADVVVATYESFLRLMRLPNFSPGVVVADEVHLIADIHRGPVVEGLLARMMASGRTSSLCALSAVVQNADEIARWLGIKLLKGSANDRPVSLEIQCRTANDLDESLSDVLQPCLKGTQALVFCSSKPGAQRITRDLSETMSFDLAGEQVGHLSHLAERIEEEDEMAGDLAEILPTGVAYHHAGLSKQVRKRVEAGFREGWIRVLVGTTTLAAGVNLPADIAVVRDIFRSEQVRDFHRRAVIPSGEVLNMLGRAGRPGQVESGLGIALVPEARRSEPPVKQLIQAVKAGVGGDVVSRLTDSFENLMRFVLSLIIEREETTHDDIANAFSHTLAHFSAATPVDFDRDTEKDLLSALPNYQKVIKANGAIKLRKYDLTAEGVEAIVDSSGKPYTVTIGLSETGCTCPAASQYFRDQICKHQSCAIHDLIFGINVGLEARLRTIYDCGHLLNKALPIGTLLNLALEILAGWGLIEAVPGGFRPQPVGEVASASGLDLLLVHQIIERISHLQSASYQEIIQWTVEDYFATPSEAKRWQHAIKDWIAEVDIKRISLPTKFRGNFDRGLEDLSGVCLLYQRAASALGKAAIGKAASEAQGVVLYGVEPELVPLMGLRFEQLGRARARHLFGRNVRSLEDLAGADPGKVANPRRAPEAFVRAWVEKAKEIVSTKTTLGAQGMAPDEGFDELVSRFRVDRASLGS